MESKLYRVMADGVWIGTKMYNKGDEIRLRDREAKYLVLAGSIVAKGAASKPAPKKEPASAGGGKGQGSASE